MRLFEVQFADGFAIVQTPDDRAVHYPKEDGGGSAWTDVIGHSQVSTPEWFMLHGEDLGAAEYRLHLPTGTFFAGDTPFRLHGMDDLPLAEMELVYYRRRMIDAEFSTKDGSHISHSERPKVYRFGFKARRATGESAEFVIEVD